MSTTANVRPRGWSGALLAVVIAVMYAPVATVFIYSFNASRLGSVWTGFSTQWYVSLLNPRDPAWRSDLWSALGTSLLIGGVASTLSVALGMAAALGLQGWSRRSRALAEGAFALPLVVPDIIMAVALALFFHAVRMPFGLATVIAAHLTFGISYALVVIAAAVADLDPNLHAAALDCGATRRQAFLHVTAPLLAPSLVVAWLLVFSLSFDDFLITFFTKGTGNETLPIKIYAQMRFGVRPDTNALFVLLFAATLAGALLTSRLTRKPSGGAR